MKGKWLLVFLAVVVVLSALGCETPGAFHSTPLHINPDGHVVGDLQCQDPHVTVVIGKSVELMNPCPLFPGGAIDGSWLDAHALTGTDDFVTGDCRNAPVLPGPVNGISGQTCFTGTQCTITNSTANQTRRFLVADKTAQPQVDLPVCYTYTNSNPIPPAGGTGTLFVTTIAPGPASFTLTVVSLADPKLNLYVFSSPMGIQCFQGANCSAPFSAGTKVILTAEASSATWTGCDTFTNSTCTIAMNADRKVTVSSP